NSNNASIFDSYINQELEKRLGVIEINLAKLTKLIREDTKSAQYRCSEFSDYNNGGLEKRLEQIEAHLAKFVRKDTKCTKTPQQSCEIISDWLGDNSGDISIVSFFTSKSPPTISDESSETRIDLDPDAFFFAYLSSNEPTHVLEINQGHEMLRNSIKSISKLTNEYNDMQGVYSSYSKRNDRDKAKLHRNLEQAETNNRKLSDRIHQLIDEMSQLRSEMDSLNFQITRKDISLADSKDKLATKSKEIKALQS
ncbi:11658_t:CDS:2, partial [Funneliformis geosporum]